jgi:hypothetical protein
MHYTQTAPHQAAHKIGSVLASSNESNQVSLSTITLLGPIMFPGPVSRYGFETSSWVEWRKGESSEGSVLDPV